MWGRAWSKFKRNKLAVAGGVFVILLILTAYVGPYLLRYPYDGVDYTAVYQGPSAQHWFGADDLGRDLFSRLVYSLRTAMNVAFGAAVITLAAGLAVGAAAGYFGGKVDNLLMRITDIMFAFPSFLFNVMLIAVMGRGLLTIFVAIGVTSWVGLARLVRAEVMKIKAREFVEAGHAMGASHWSIITRYILPNVLGPVIVSMSFSVPGAMMTESALSLIGMGVAPPAPSFGGLITAGQRFVLSYPHMLLYPALVFAFTLLSFTWLGDGLRDAFDPRDH
jgi:ABC-type dipeptide/oligopeptide/nickel transport system permease subunit